MFMISILNYVDKNLESNMKITKKTYIPSNKFNISLLIEINFHPHTDHFIDRCGLVFIFSYLLLI